MDNNEAKIIKALFSHLPFQSCSDFYITYECLSLKDKMLDRFKNNNFNKEMQNYVNTFSKDNYTCDYYTESKFNNIFKNHQKSSLKTFHANLDSFESKKYLLVAYLESLKGRFSIIGLTEIGSTSIESIMHIFEDYEIFMVKSKTNKGGAALLVLRNHFKNIIDLRQNDNYNFENMCKCSKCNVESQFISLETNNTKLIVGCIYRHPKGEINHFTEHFQKLVNGLDRNSTAIIMGDFNIDLIDCHNSKVENYINVCLENNFVPCITQPTRITDHSATLVDHILLKTSSRLIQNKVTAGNLISGLSDHLSNFLIFDLNVHSYQNRPKIRLFTEEKINNFMSNIENDATMLNSQLEGNDANEIYKKFIDNFISIYNKYFPLIRMSRKRFKQKPYITKGILVSIKNKNLLYKKYLEHQTPLRENAYKRCRNMVVNLINKSETEYHRSLITKYNNNNCQLWKCFGYMLNKKKVKHNKISMLNINGSLTANKNYIVEEFNNFFSKIGEKLASKIENSNDIFRNYLNDPKQQSILLTKTNEDEIIHQIKSLENGKSTGHDGINARFLKLCSPYVSPILANIFNLAIKTGIYPDELKIAKVIPIFKSGDTTECTNYRPISVLSIIDNVFERILKKRMVEYLEKCNILYEYQFGFREGHSTTHALVEIIDNIKESIDKNNMTCGIFVDLSKAFDTVNHHILLAKLENYGFRGKAYELLSSYLSNRKQYVQLNDHKSSYKPISCGVPQGSVLGPLLFLIYINDIANCCPQEKTRIYADDTNIFFDSNNVDDISERAHQIMIQLDKWFIANKLTLNAKKSSFTIFRSLRSKTKNLPDKLVFNKSEIIRSATVTYLGVLLDEHLTFKNHVQKVCNSIKMYFKVFYNIRRYISSKQI